ncbi:MAG: hypothetical protein OEL20_05035 [Sulfuritalea sp.]|nr:hypothetical protein [Sulfuritalea sp.]
MEIPILYHGTRKQSATRILKSGFRRSTRPSYTGTGINLSESITVSYEYGEYENGGAVLEVRLRADTRWSDQIDARHNGIDGWFKANPPIQALSLFGGNVWVVWDASAIESVRRMSHLEALKALHDEIVEDGPAMGYNGIAQDYASVIFGSPDPNLDRFPGYRELWPEHWRRSESSFRATPNPRSGPITHHQESTMSLRVFRSTLKHLAHAEALAMKAVEAALSQSDNPQNAVTALRRAAAQCKRLHRARRKLQARSGMRVVAKAYLAVSPHH